MVNWKVRIKNKVFWFGLIPAVLLLAKTVLEIFGVEIDFGVLQGQLLGLVEAVFTLLAVLGIVVDPTTEGVGDSKLALSYEEPKPKGE